MNRLWCHQHLGQHCEDANSSIIYWPFNVFMLPDLLVNACPTLPNGPESSCIWTTSIWSQLTEPLPVSLILCLDMKTDRMRGSLWNAVLSRGWACWFNHILIDLHTHTDTHLLRFAGHVRTKADSSSCLVFLWLHWCGGRQHWVVVSPVCVCGPVAVVNLFPTLTLGVCTLIFTVGIPGLKWQSNGAGHFRDGPDCFSSLAAAVSAPAAWSACWQLDFSLFSSGGNWRCKDLHLLVFSVTWPD